MRFHGDRRARGITLILAAGLLVALWQVSRLYAQHAVRSLGPTLLAQARRQLGKDLTVEKLVLDEPGKVLARGVRVAQGKSFNAGILLAAERVELTYDPALLAWSSLWSGGRGARTRATLRVKGLVVNRPNPLPVLLPLGPLAAAEEMSADFDLGPVLAGRGNVLATVDRVSVERLQGTAVRRRDGTWDLAEHLKQKDPGFRGELVARRSEITLVDLAPGSLPPQRNVVRGDFRLEFAGAPALRFAGRGDVIGENGGSFEVSGVRDGQRSWSSSFRAHTTKLAYWFRYFVEKPDGVEILGGTADVVGASWDPSVKPGSKPQFRVDLHVRDGAARIPKIGRPFTRFSGRIISHPDALTVMGTASIGSTPVRLSGDVLIGKPGRAEWTLSSRAVTLQTARELFPGLKLPEELALAGPVELTAQLSGEDEVWSTRGEARLPATRYAEGRAPSGRLSFNGRFGEGVTPEVDGGFMFPSLALPGYALERPAGRFSLRDHVVHLTGSFTTCGGKGTARGWLDLSGEKPQFYATGRLTGVDLASLPRDQVGDTPISGTATAEFVASGTRDAPQLSAFVRASQARYGDFASVEASARVRLEGKDLVIEQGVVRDPRGELEVAGRVTEQRELALRVAGRGLQLSGLLPPEKDQPRMSGQLYLTGEVTGTPKAPRFAGKAQVYHFSYDRWRGDYAEAAVEACDSFVQISGLNLLGAPARLTAGRLTLTRSGKESAWEVGGAVEVHGLTIGQALQLGADPKSVKEWPVTGDLRGLTLSLSGSARAPLVGFTASAARVQARGIELGTVSAEGRFDPARRLLEVRRAEVAAPEGALSASGTVQLPREADRPWEEAQLALDLKIERAGLGALLARYGGKGSRLVSVAGEMDAGGRVSGTAAAPRVALDGVTVRNLRVNGIAASLAPFSVSYQGGAAVVRDLHLQARGGHLRTAYLAVKLPDGPKKPLRWAGAPLEIAGLPVELVLEALETAPGVTDRQLDWLDTFDLWAERHGQVEAQLAFSSPPSGATDAQILARLEEPAAPLPTGSVVVTGLKPSAGLGAEAAVRAEFAASSGEWVLKTATLTQPGGIRASLSGRVKNAESENPGLEFKFAVEDLDLSLSARLPDPALRSRVHALQPLRGKVDLAGSLSGTRKSPAAAFSLDVREPVVAGIPLDRASVAAAEYSAAEERLKLGSAVLTRRPSADAPEASVRFSGFLPVTWPELAIPGDAPRDVTVEMPKQPLSVLNALAADVEKAAAQFSYDLPEGRERFARLFGHVVAPDGVIEGRVRLAGTANNPDNSGVLSVRCDQVRLLGSAASGRRAVLPAPDGAEAGLAGAEPLETRIQQFRAAVELAGDRLRLVELSGQSSHGGAFRGSGEVVLGRGVNGGPAARLNLSVAVDHLRVSERDAARVLGEPYRGTQLRLTLSTVRPADGGGPAPIRITGDWPSVNVAGAVRVEDASLPLALDAPPGDAGTPLPDNVTLSLAVLPGKNVWLRNPVVRLEIQPPTYLAGKLEGALLVTHRLSAPIIQGTLRAEHGVFNLPLIRLRNAEGTIRVAYDGRTRSLEAVQPNSITVDLTAETTLRIQRSAAIEAEYYDATFEIRGSPGTGGAAGIRSAGLETGLALGAEGGLNVTVRTDPPLPSTQIEALIRQQYVAEGFGSSGANVVEALRGQIEQALAVNVASELTGRVEDVVRSALGLNIFSVDFGVAQPLRVRLGRRLFGPVYGTIAQSFGQAEDQVERRYELYYRVSPQFRIGYRQDDPLGRKVIFFSGTAAF